MHRRIVAIAMASMLSFSAAASLHAAPLGIFHTVPKPSTGKTIRFSVRNGSSATIVVRAGEQQFTIEPGKTVNMKLPEGAELVSVSGGSNETPGTILTKVSSVLQNNTLVIG